MSKHVSLAQRLAQLEQPTPVDFDPEDITITNGEAEDTSEQTANEGREHYLDVGPSALRSKLHESLSDPKYKGVRVSRKQLGGDDGELSDDAIDNSRVQPVTSEEEDENSNGGDGNTGRYSLHESLLEHTPGDVAVINSALQRTDEHDFSVTLKRAREEEREKGKAVARQLAIYDGLLDARIRLQKCVTSMNRLPNAINIPNYFAGAGSRDATTRLLAESVCLVDDLCDLQAKLLNTGEALNVPARKRQKEDRNVQTDCDWEEEIHKRSIYFAELEATFHSHLLTTLQKWSNKVLAITPAALLPANRTKFSSKNANQIKSAVQLADEALMEREKLLARTQSWRGMGDRLAGALQPESTDASHNDATAGIFDDTDFYQALLRDVIDARSGASRAGVGLNGLSADWRASQQQRKKAHRAIVDTRASKGRKLRFEVHEKLQNFMVPAPSPSSAAWHGEQIDELFASLLGKGFPDVKGMHEEVRPSMDIEVEKTLKGGFRVFG